MGLKQSDLKDLVYHIFEIDTYDNDISDYGYSNIKHKTLVQTYFDLIYSKINAIYYYFFPQIKNNNI